MKVHQFFEWSARETPDAEFARQGERRIRYAEAREQAVRMAAALQKSGVGPGDRFVYLSRNSIEFVIGYLAASLSGAVIVPLNYRQAPAEWSGIIADSGARLAVAAGDLVDAMAGLVPSHATVAEWIALDRPAPCGWRKYGDWLARSSADLGNGAGADELCQMYTSGTTGKSKGAVLTHGSVIANAWQISLTLANRVRRGERSLVVMPVFHAGAASQVFGGLVFGWSFVIHEEFDPERVVRSLAEDGIAVTSLVPAMIKACLGVTEKKPAHRYDTMVAIYYGASPIDETTLRRALAAFRCPFYQAYGMTETSAVVTVLSGADHERALAGKPELLLSAGRPIPGTEVIVADSEDRPLPPGRPGQILVRGPQLMRGYWRRPEANDAALAGGWMHTGDVGYLDQDGYLYLLDRLNDTINSGGENVYPREVENAILSHAEVADAVVVGVPDERGGEAVLAVVVRRAGSEVGEAELIGHCRTMIGGYKVPRQVVFVDALPRNATGKVLRRELREPYWQGRTRRVG